MNQDAQTEEEIRAFVREMNDAWTKEGNPEALSRFFHPRMVAFTGPNSERLEGGEACVAGWKGFCEAARILHWEEKAMDIRVYGEAAVVSYFFEIHFQVEEQEMHSEGRDMFFLVKEEGRWWAVGDHFS
jgi:uncharacterized protein (TIGR02246 family)